MTTIRTFCCPYCGTRHTESEGQKYCPDCEQVYIETSRYPYWAAAAAVTTATASPSPAPWVRAGSLGIRQPDAAGPSSGNARTARIS